MYSSNGLSFEHLDTVQLIIKKSVEAKTVRGYTVRLIWTTKSPSSLQQVFRLEIDCNYSKYRIPVANARLNTDYLLRHANLPDVAELICQTATDGYDTFIRKELKAW